MNTRVVVLLVILLSAGGWFGYRYWMNPERVAKRKAAAEIKTEIKREERAIEGAKRDYEKKRPKLEQKVKEYQQQISEVVLFPITLKELTDQTTVPLPAGRAPVVYVAPLYGMADKPSSATAMIESMIRYQLRPSVYGPVGLNLVPFKAVTLPYRRKANAPEMSSFKPDQHLSDARKLGADLLVYGRADMAQDAVSVQLVCFDTRTSRTEQFAKSVPGAELPTVVAEAANTVIRMAGLDDAAAAACGLKPVPETLPTLAILKAAMATDENTLDTTAARNLAMSGGGKCPWYWENLALTLGGDGGIDLINEALRATPKDPRLLMAKANVLHGADPYTASAAPLLALMALCRQPDSLMAASTVGMFIGDGKAAAGLPIVETYEQFKALAGMYPAYWPLRWDLARAGGVVTLSRRNLAFAEFWQENKKTPEKDDVPRLEQAAAKYEVADAAMADMRAASDMRPDCPSILVDMTYWHRILYRDLKRLDPASDIQWQMPMLARVNLLDPQNVEADLNVAWSLAGVDSGRQMEILRRAMQRTNRNPAVMQRVASNILETLRLKSDWYKTNDEMRQREGVSRVVQLPEAQLFRETLFAALDADDPGIWWGLQNMAWLLSRCNQPMPDTWHRFYAWKNNHYKLAQDHNKAEEWEKALSHARRIVGMLEAEDTELMRLIMVRSLWKLGRLREALYQAEIGIQEVPRKHTFHYMFAVVAVELNDRLEEAYERLVTASELAPDNQAIKALMRKLGERRGGS